MGRDFRGARGAIITALARPPEQQNIMDSAVPPYRDGRRRCKVGYAPP